MTDKIGLDRENALNKVLSHSRKLRAYHQAWEIIKSHELAGTTIDGFEWINPKIGGDTLIRKLRFSELSSGVSSYNSPDNFNLSILSPSNIIDPNVQGLIFGWTLPYLQRIKAESVPFNSAINRMIGNYTSAQIRPRIELLSFLPFPNLAASIDDCFNPQFRISLDFKLEQGHYMAAISKHGGVLYKQQIDKKNPSRLEIFANPSDSTYFDPSRISSFPMSPSDFIGEIELYLYQFRMKSPNSYTTNQEIDNLKSERDGSESYLANYVLSDSDGEYDSLSVTGPSLFRDPLIPDEGESVSKEDKMPVTSIYQFGVQPIKIYFLGVDVATKDKFQDRVNNFVSRYKT